MPKQLVSTVDEMDLQVRLQDHCSEIRRSWVAAGVCEDVVKATSSVSPTLAFALRFNKMADGGRSSGMICGRNLSKARDNGVTAKS